MNIDFCPHFIYRRLVAVLVFIAPVVAQAERPSVEVVQSAIAAVNRLGESVVKGDYATVLQRVNPTWRERLATRLGGGQAFLKQFQQAAQALTKQGMSVVSMKAQGFPQCFEVFPGKKVEMVNGRSVETLISTKWLLLVPTQKIVRLTTPTENMMLEVTGFQVAVSDKAQLDWSFIDGAAVSVADLRAMFINFPMDQALPESNTRLLPKQQ